MSLLDKVKATPKSRQGRRAEITQDEIELALALLKKEVTLSQAASTLGITITGVYVWAFPRLVEAQSQGLIEIVRMASA